MFNIQKYKGAFQGARCQPALEDCTARGMLSPAARLQKLPMHCQKCVGNDSNECVRLQSSLSVVALAVIKLDRPVVT